VVLKSLKEIDVNRYELQIKVESAVFKKAIDTAYNKKTKELILPGFRKGKAPRTLVKKYYGEEIFLKEAIKNTYPSATQEAIKESKLDVILEEKIGINILEAEKEEGLLFNATVIVKPEAKIKNYKGLILKKSKPIRVSNKEVDDKIYKMSKQNSRIFLVEDRSAQLGDIVVVCFESFVDGKLLEKVKNIKIELEDDKTNFDFVKNIVGHNINEKFEFEIKFPRDYPVAAEFKSKTISFKTIIKKIQAQEMPQINDDFVKDVSEFDTLVEFKKHIKEKIKNQKISNEQQRLKNKITDQLQEIVEVEVPHSMIEKKIKENLKNFNNELSQRGLNLESYLEHFSITTEKFANDIKKSSEKQVKIDLAIEKIAKNEKIIVTEEDIKKEFKNFNDDSNINSKNMRLIMENPFLKEFVLHKKIYDFLIKNSVEFKKLSKNSKKSDKINDESKNNVIEFKDKNLIKNGDINKLQNQKSDSKKQEPKKKSNKLKKAKSVKSKEKEEKLKDGSKIKTLKTKAKPKTSKKNKPFK
jgi:trigger factor